MSGQVDELRAAGFGEDEIQAHFAPQVNSLQQAGFSEEEIGKHLGVRPVDVAQANRNLAARVHSEITKADDGGKAKQALAEMGQTVKDASTVYAPIEAALNVATGATLGFPMYLGAGLGTVLARSLGLTDDDPKEVAKRFSEVVTYQPHTDAGQRFTGALTYPLRTLIDMSESAGKKVADVTGSPTAAAITEATIQTLPAVLVPPLARALRGKAPTESDMHIAAQEIAGEGAPPKTVAELRDKVHDTYEKTGIDPETLRDQAAQDVQVKQDLASSNRTPFEAVGERISVGEQHTRKTGVSELYTAVKDDLYPIAEMEKALADGGPLDVAESPYKLARLVRGGAGKATEFLDYGTFDFETYKNTGPGLKQILEPVKNDLEGFRTYAVARRAVELDKRGIETGVPIDDAKVVVKEGGKYGETFKALQDYQTSLVKYLRDSGLITEDAFNGMVEANKDYVPFHRLFSEAKGSGVGPGMSVRSPIKAIKGSERKIVDPLESIIKNTYLYTGLAERNAVGAALGKLVGANPEMAENLGVKSVKAGTRPIEVSAAEVAKFMEQHGIEGDAEAFTIFRANAMRPSANQIRYFEDGKPVTLELPEAVADAFNAADRQSAGLLLRILAAPAKTLRAGSVLAPDFMLRNVMRDQLTAFAFSKNGYIPVWDMVSGAASLVGKDAAFQDWLKSGGANSAMVSLDRQYLQQHLFDLDKNAGLMSRAWNLAKSPIEVLRITSELFENATRLGEFKRAMAGKEPTKANIQSAGFESREVTLDFQRIGAQTRGLNMIAAFMNAGVEGLDRTARAFKDAPIATTAKVAASITAPSILLWAANHDDPRYKEIPQWERDLFWIAMTKDHIYRIPKPFEVGVIFGTLPERMLDKIAADNPDAFKHFGDTLLQAFGVNILPTGAVPLLEQTTNHSFFTGNPLIPSRMEKLLPEYQYHEYTTQLSRAVGQAIGAFPGMHDKSIASPAVIDNYIRGWTGTLGVYVRDALDKGLREAGVLPDPPQPIATLADIPVIKAFVVRYPSAQAQSVQDFYERYGQQKKVYDTFQQLVSDGDADAAIKEAKLDPSAFARMDGIHTTLGELNAVIRTVWKQPDMTPSDKRQLIDTLYGQMIELAQAGNLEMISVDKALGTDKESIVDKVKRALKQGGNSLVLPVLDHFEQSANRDRDYKERPLTGAERAWNEMMDLHRKGAPVEEVDAAADRFAKLRDKGTVYENWDWSKPK